ncbi:leucine-rich repeats and immunoglobulin-like domains protein 1-like [Arapaima gigas]
MTYNGTCPHPEGPAGCICLLLTNTDTPLSSAVANMHLEIKCCFWVFSLFTALWSTAAPEAISCEESSGCGGAPQAVNCSSPFLQQLQDRMLSERLDLSKHQLSIIPIGKFRPFCRLKVLLLNDNNISALEDGTFCPLENLLKLDLRRNRVSSLGEGFSVGLVSLRELLLAKNQLKHLNAGSFLHLGDLQRLDLSSNVIHSIDLMAFAGLTSLRHLHLQSNQLLALSTGIFSTLQSLEVLHLQGNRINSTDMEVFTPLSSLATLNLTQNQLSFIHFRTFLSINSHSIHILLGGNRWHCNCDLQRVFHKFHTVRRLFLNDYSGLHCAEPLELLGRRLAEVDSELCMAETVTVLIITLTVLITVVASIVMAERNRKKQTGKHWSEDSNMSYSAQT